jgi:four helix bundle protein
MQRSSISAVANLVEGVGRNRNTEAARFVRIALGSCTELECEVLLSRDLGYFGVEISGSLPASTRQLRAMLAWFHRRLIHEHPRRSSSQEVGLQGARHLIADS